MILLSDISLHFTVPQHFTEYTMGSAKYRSPPQPPPLFNGTAESIITIINGYFERHRGILDGIVTEVTPATATFETVMKPILLSENEADKVKWVN